MSIVSKTNKKYDVFSSEKSYENEDEVQLKPLYIHVLMTGEQ